MVERLLTTLVLTILSIDGIRAITSHEYKADIARYKRICDPI